MTEQTKNKGGRPKADKHGQMVWVKADYLETVKAFIELLDSVSKKNYLAR